jgi:hypothetical protein
VYRCTRMHRIQGKFPDHRGRVLDEFRCLLE